MFRRGHSYAVWDHRGLTLRSGKHTHSTRMAEVAVSPRLFARAQILQTLDSIKSGARSKNASSLSGARRVGSGVYFLLRWTNKKDNAPWLEALVLTEKKPKPKLIGRFDGLSTATLPVDDQLFVLQDQLAAVTRQDAVWGLSTFNVGRTAFEWQPYGARLTGFLPVGVRGGLFVERTDWGTTAGGRVDFVGKVRRDLFEGRGQMRFLDSAKPPLATIGTPPSSSLRNGETGAALPLPASSGVRRTARGILVWYPATAPTSATLYEPERWEPLGTWSADDAKP
jgi:hypothetical protein